MPILLLHLVAGLVTGAFFRIQTLLILVFLVLVEFTICAAMGGIFLNALLWVVAEVALQLGYLGGIYLRSLLERSGFSAFLYAGKRS